MTTEETRAECDCRLQREAAEDALRWKMLAEAECTHDADLLPPLDCE